MDDQDHHRLPHLQRVGDEEIAPAQRGEDEERHAALDDAARIEAVGQRPEATENSRNGSQCETMAKPASAGEWNFWNTTQ